jgi:hypothetical protein
MLADLELRTGLKVRLGVLVVLDEPPGEDLDSVLLLGRCPDPYSRDVVVEVPRIGGRDL